MRGTRLLRNHVLQIRIAAISLRRGRNRTGLYSSLSAAQCFIVAEEEYFIPAVKNVRNYDRSPNREPKLVLPQFAFLCVRGTTRVQRSLKIVSGIQFVVTEKLPYVAMELIGTRFDAGVQHGGAGAAELGTEVCRLDFELLDRIDGRQHHEIRAVQEIDRI